MSKEELLKHLIAEIDLIMHDKDYRFENANGTWYSRESCRDLTNEEVFEELRTELRQLADIEAELAESKRNNLILYSMLYQTLEKQGCEDIASEINQMRGLMLEKQADWFKGNKLFNQTAIEKLEKVKKLLVEKMKLASDKLDCAYYINQQINELKGKVGDVKD